jgi:hypothetical protein
MSVSIAPVSRDSFKAWANDVNHDATYHDGDAYIASHVWDSEDYNMEIFGESPFGDDVQARLKLFLDKDLANWSDQPTTRKAKWSEFAPVDGVFIVGSLPVEIVGNVGGDGNHPAWVETLCKRLKSVDHCLEQADGQTSQRNIQKSSTYSQVYSFRFRHCRQLRTCCAHQIYLDVVRL